MTELNRRAQLVAGRAAAMVLYARQWTHGRDAAEDVVQEALTALLAQPAGAVAGGALTAFWARRPGGGADRVAWMFRAAQRGAIDGARADTRRRRRERA